MQQLGLVARREFEELMALGNYEYQSDFVRKIVAEKAKAIQDGRDEGLREGRDEGLREGLRRALAALLRDKFAVTDAALAPLAEATTQQLERWTRRVLSADSVDAVFAE